ARLWGEKRYQEFSATVNGAVYRVSALALLASAWMAAAALPLVDLVYRRGHFQLSDAKATSAFFLWFALSLAFWAAQGLYARAFYAAGNTLTPMIAGTVITAASLPLYSALFARYGVVGLAMASDVGIVLHTVVLAALLHTRKVVPLGGLPWGGLGKALFAGGVAAVSGVGLAKLVYLDGTRLADLLNLLLVTLTWGGAVAAVLWVTNSDLLRMLRRREPPPAEPSLVAVEAVNGCEVRLCRQVMESSCRTFSSMGDVPFTARASESPESVEQRNGGRPPRRTPALCKQHLVRTTRWRKRPAPSPSSSQSQ